MRPFSFIVTDTSPLFTVALADALDVLLRPGRCASCATIRLKLLKIGALVRTSVRRIKLAMPSAVSYQAEYRAAHAALTGAGY